MKSFIINGKEYKVNFGHNALCELEKKLGKSVTEIGSEEYSATQVQALFWAGLLAENRGISYEKAGDILDMVDDYTDFIGELVDEFAASFARRFKTSVVADDDGESKKK